MIAEKIETACVYLNALAGRVDEAIWEEVRAVQRELSDAAAQTRAMEHTKPLMIDAGDYNDKAD